VKLTMGDGTVREFRKPGVTDEMLAKGTRRTMDCTDCHNRPSHSFAASAERAANDALALGQVPRSLPFARRELVKALKTDAATKDEALAAIETSLRGFYSGAEVTTKPAAPEVDRAVTVAKALYSTNVFPQMKITWGSYRNELGHIDSPGCFRCHDEEKATPDGRKISQDCESCHRMR
jgi:Cytochrome c7 and related cytochrome c